MSDALASTDPVPVLVPWSARSLLAYVNHRIVEAKTMLRHRHDDEPYWSGLDTTAPQLQRARPQLACVANLLHVARATARGRIHGTRFESLDAQAEWLRSQEKHACRVAAGLLGLPPQATLLALRAGEVVGPAELVERFERRPRAGATRSRESPDEPERSPELVGAMR